MKYRDKGRLCWRLYNYNMNCYCKTVIYLYISYASLKLHLSNENHFQVSFSKMTLTSWSAIRNVRIKKLLFYLWIFISVSFRSYYFAHRHAKWILHEPFFFFSQLSPLRKSEVNDERQALVNEKFHRSGMVVDGRGRRRASKSKTRLHPWRTCTSHVGGFSFANYGVLKYLLPPSRNSRNDKIQHEIWVALPQEEYHVRHTKRVMLCNSSWGLR